MKLDEFTILSVCVSCLYEHNDTMILCCFEAITYINYLFLVYYNFLFGCYNLFCLKCNFKQFVHNIFITYAVSLQYFLATFLQRNCLLFRFYFYMYMSLYLFKCQNDKIQKERINQMFLLLFVYFVYYVSALRQQNPLGHI